jgi:Tfp pilus assembly protein PilN
MIHVNLLPEEYRRKARTPIKVTLAVAAAAGVNAMLVAWYAWLALGVMAEVDSERDVLQTELDGLKPQLAYHKSLGDEQKSFAAREVTLAAITLSRINWTKKLDELVTVINSGGEGERHYIWLDDLNVTQTSDPRSKSAGSVRAAGHSGSDNFSQIANFLEDLEKSPFIEAFEPPAAPEGSQSNKDEELIPPVVWSFPMQLNLKSLEVRMGELAGSKAPVKPGANATKPGAAPAAPAETAPAPAPVEGQAPAAATPAAATPAATTPGAKEDKR